MEGDYQKWDIVRRAKDTGPDIFPATPAGAGLPSNLINDVLIADDDTIYVGTTCGLARSSDFGATWNFLRGADWQAKLKGLYQPLAPEPPRENLNRELLREDYITNLAEDEKGLLWIGYRQKGYEIRRPLPDRVAYVSALKGKETFPYVSTLLPMGDGTALIASYGAGLGRSVAVPAYVPNEAETKEMAQRRGWKQAETPRAVPPLPATAQSPTSAELETLIAQAEAVPAAAEEAPLVVPLADDWTTQGDWLGRYGRYWMLGCAFSSPHNYVWGAGALPVRYNLRISPQQKGDSIRYWVHWLSTSNPRVLEMPPVYGDSRLQKHLAKAGELRRQSEADDHGEAYPLTKEGPNIYASLKIPAGLYTLSFYNHNKDGHEGMNRMRDYRISVRSRPADVELRNLDDFAAWPEVARSRQRDFWGGVYQKFLVRGPQKLTVEFHRNNSFNTILAGIFLDEVNEQPLPYFEGQNLSFDLINLAEPQLPDSASVNRLWAALERAKASNPAWWASESRRFYAPLARWHQLAAKRTATQGLPRVYQRLGTSYYNLGLYPQWETMQKRRGLIPAREIEKSLTWDGKLYDERGKGRQLITAALTAQRDEERKTTPSQGLK